MRDDWCTKYQIPDLDMTGYLLSIALFHLWRYRYAYFIVSDTSNSVPKMRGLYTYLQHRNERDEMIFSHTSDIQCGEAVSDGISITLMYPVEAQNCVILRTCTEQVYNVFSVEIQSQKVARLDDGLKRDSGGGFAKKAR